MLINQNRTPTNCYLELKQWNQEGYDNQHVAVYTGALLKCQWIVGSFSCWGPDGAGRDAPGGAPEGLRLDHSI